jgi:hypothetical protein
MSSHDSTDNEKGVLGAEKEQVALDAAGQEKSASHLNAVKTRERVPGHEDYYEKDGLRTYGDDEDHDHEPPVRETWRWIEKMALS